MDKYKRYKVILKGGTEQFICAKSAKEACEKVRKLLPSKEIVGYCEVDVKIR